MRRYDCLQRLAAAASDDVVVTNLANTATEWHAVRPSDANVYCVGMGLVTAYALGIAAALPDVPIVALDGDGGILFDLSVLGLLAEQRPRNLRVIVFDNGGYVSTGKLPDVASQALATVSIEALAATFGLQAITVSTIEQFGTALHAPHTDGPLVIVAKTDAEQAFVGALPLDLKENKYRFMRHVEGRLGRRLLVPSGKEHGAPPKADPTSSAVGGTAQLAEVLCDGLREARVDYVVGLPCSGLSAAQARCRDMDDLSYVPVANEGTGLGLCAGAWLGGRRPAALIENFGLFASCYQLLRGHLSFGLATLLVVEYRGDAGDQEFFAETGELTEDLLRAMRINFRVVERLEDIKPAIRDAWRWMDACLRPYAILPRFDLARPRAGA